MPAIHAFQLFVTALGAISIAGLFIKQFPHMMMRNPIGAIVASVAALYVVALGILCALLVTGIIHR